MDSSTGNKIYVFPQFCNVIRSPLGPVISAGNNFNLVIDILAKHSYTSDQNIIIEESHFDMIRWAYKYNSFSWDIVDKELLSFDFLYPLEEVIWNGADKILKSKDDLIQKILEFAYTMQDAMPPFQDDDTVYMNLTFIKPISVSPQEFELAQGRILTKQYETIEKILWKKVRAVINGLRCESSLYEEFQRLEVYVETVMRETANWRTMYLDENYERVLIESLIKQARREFRLLPVVISRMQYLEAAQLSQNELIDDCSICMSGYLPGSEAYKLPCNHSFHFSCIETWLLNKPSCPMCRLKLPPTE